MPGFQLKRFDKAHRVLALIVEQPRLAEMYAPLLHDILRDARADIEKLRADVGSLRRGGRPDLREGCVTVRARQVYVKRDLWDRRPHVCQRCDCALDYDTCRPHHIVPVSEGGSDEDDNVELLCVTCHRREHERYPAEVARET